MVKNVLLAVRAEACGRFCGSIMLAGSSCGSSWRRYVRLETLFTEAPAKKSFRKGSVEARWFEVPTKRKQVFEEACGREGLLISKEILKTTAHLPPLLPLLMLVFVVAAVVKVRAVMRVTCAACSLQVSLPGGHLPLCQCWLVRFLSKLSLKDPQTLCSPDHGISTQGLRRRRKVGSNK